MEFKESDFRPSRSCFEKLSCTMILAGVLTGVGGAIWVVTEVARGSEWVDTVSDAVMGLMHLK